jgi:hypothetical protein
VVRTFRRVIDAAGALVDISIGLTAANVQTLRTAGQPIPQSLSLHALIDTGAEFTCVDPAALAPLLSVGLSPSRIILANLPVTVGLNATREFFVTLTVIHPTNLPRANLVLRNHPIIEQPLGPLGYQALLGRDVLEHCLLVYDGPGRSVTLAF